MENNNNQEQNTATQTAQNLTSGNTGTQDKPLTTEGFHTLLAANTFELSKARIAYATEIADLQQEYDNTMDTILEKEHQANYELREARDKFEKAKEEYELFLRELKKERNEAGRTHNEGKAEAKNRWAAVNEQIQSIRHNIFERYRNSGGDCPRTQIPIGGNLQIESERPDDMGKTSESLAELGGNQSGYAQEISNRKFETPSNGVIGRPGGALSQGTEGLLHPAWTKDKKGEMSDEER